MPMIVKKLRHRNGFFESLYIFLLNKFFSPGKQVLDLCGLKFYQNIRSCLYDPFLIQTF